MPTRAMADEPVTGKEVRIFLIEYDLRPGEFAKIVGISGAYLSNLLNGRKPMTRLVERSIRNAMDKVVAEYRLKECHEPASKGA